MIQKEESSHYCQRQRTQEQETHCYSCYRCPCCNSRSSRCSVSAVASSCVPNFWNVMLMMMMSTSGGTSTQQHHHHHQAKGMFLMCGLYLLLCFTFASAAEATTSPTNNSSALEDHAQVAPVPEQAVELAQISGNCSQVKCPPVESCPEDSYRLPSLVSSRSRRHHEGNAFSSVLSLQQQNCCPTPSPQKCRCIPDLLCSPKECSTGFVAHVFKNATGKPGGCCPQYECLPSLPPATGESLGGGNALYHYHPHHHSQHQHSGNFHHPPEKLDGTSLHPSSSSTTDFDSDSGFDLSLEDDQDLSKYDDDSEEGDGLEDSSANDFNNNERSRFNNNQQQFLLNDETDVVEKGHCYHDGKVYKSGDHWTVQSECSECSCENGLVSCKQISCNVPAECRLARAQPLSCCPVCDGCISSSGKAYNMSEVWQEDPCTNCTCQGGRIQCHTSSCKRQHSCAKPKYYPGECCPRCENDVPEIGSPLTFDKDHSCPFHDCHRDVSCPNGFRLDKLGCPTCECQKCQSMVGCTLPCSRGFKVDSFGCTVCECVRDEDLADLANNNNVIPFSSSSSFPSRSRTGNNGQANLEPQHGKVDQRNLRGNPGGGGNANKDLIEHDGQHQFEYHHHQHNGGNHYHNRQHHPHLQHLSSSSEEDEEEEQDASADDDHDIGDHNDGYGYGNSNEARSRTSSSSSSSPSSSSSISSTTGNSNSAAVAAALVLCAVDSDGVRRMEGEEWSDHCRRCVCRNGKEMCSLITCQAPKCEHPIFYPDDCCPRCPVEDSTSSFSPVNVSICLSSDGTERVEGEMWSLSSCLTCTCHSGQVLCAAPECPPTPCPSPKLVDCCLQCPNEKTDNEDSDDISSGSPSSSALTKNCLSDDSVKTYLDGETWRVGACQSCRCEAGQIKCYSAGKCPPLECSRPVLAKNQCCPICLDKGIRRSTPPHHGVEGAIELHHLLNSGNGGNLLKNHDLHHEGATTTTTASRVPSGGLEPHCAVLIACLLVVTILLSLYIVRQVCFHRRVSRRLIKKVPVGFHSSSSSSHSPSVTPDCCYKCDYSKYCDSGGCVIGVPGGGSSTTSSGIGGTSGGGGGSGCTGSTIRGGRCVGGGSSRESSTNGSSGHLSSEQKPLFQHEHNNHHHNHQHQLDHLLLENQSVASSVIPNTPTPPPAHGGAPGLTQSLLRESDNDKV